MADVWIGYSAMLDRWAAEWTVALCVALLHIGGAWVADATPCWLAYLLTSP